MKDVNPTCSCSRQPVPCEEAASGQNVLNNQRPRPALSAAGSVLVMSDNPESPDRPGALYRDLAVPGWFRVFYYHQNRFSPGGGYVGFAVTNTGPAPVHLFRGRFGQASQASAGEDFADTGARAWLDWLDSPPAELYLTTLAPGDSYHSSQRTDYNAVSTTVADLMAVDAATGAPTPMAVTTYASTVAVPPDPLRLPVLEASVYSGPDTGGRTVVEHRGTFPHSSRVGILAQESQNPPLTIDLFVKALKNDSGSLPFRGETETGRDAVTGLTAYNTGNYAVDYRLAVLLPPAGGSRPPELHWSKVDTYCTHDIFVYRVNGAEARRCDIYLPSPGARAGLRVRGFPPPLALNTLPGLPLPPVPGGLLPAYLIQTGLVPGTCSPVRLTFTPARA